MIGRPYRTARHTTGRTRRFTLLVVLMALVGSAVLPSGTLAAVPPNASAGDLVKVIVTFKAKPGKAARDAAKAAGGTILRDYSIIPSISVELPEDAIAALRKNRLVKSVELDAQLTALDHTGATGDLEYENAWGVEHIGTKPAHDAGIKGQGIKVAVIDTGIDYIHDDADDLPYNVDPEFLSNYRGGYDFFNNDADPMDDNGHGTHVSGIIAAEKNGYLIVGVAPEVELYGLKVLGANGSGEYSGLIAALDWAVLNDMDVVNMSLGGHEVSAALQSAIQAAYAAGITLVAASGNATTIQDIINGCPVAYPAAYDEVIAVPFTDVNNKLNGFSCKGPQVDLAAPGNAIVSTVPIGSCMFCTPQGYKAESGTSMASPHVAGVAALILSKGIANDGNTATVADDVKAHLCATASPAGMATTDPRYPSWYGCGIVDANEALVVSPPTPPEGFNHAPAAADDAATTPEDQPATIAVLANDTDLDGDVLTVTAVTAPESGIATINADGTVRYAPNPNANGNDSLSYTVADGRGGTDTGAVTITVNPVNDPPVAVDDALVTTLDTPSTVVVLANDSDADDDPLLVVSATDPQNGSATVEADGSITYFPDPAFSGSDAFDYTVSDGAGDSDTGRVTVTVTSVNNPPVAVADSITTAEDTAVSLDPAANDTDEEGGDLLVVAVTQPAHGSAEVLLDDTVQYIPALDYHGPDSFGYDVVDGAGAISSGIVSVTVTSVNDPPVAVDDFATTAEDTSVNIAVAANDTDVDGDSLAAVSIAQPGVGGAVVEPDGTITYSPAANFNGTDSFWYAVSDGQGGTDTGVVSLTVTPVADPPTANPTSATTDYQTYFTVQVSGGDPDTCELTFQIVTQPTYGTLTTKSNVRCSLAAPYTDWWKVKYIPPMGFSGVDTFTFRTFDGVSWSEPATVTVTVAEPTPLHIGDLDRSKTVQTTSWTARVTVRVDEPNHVIASGVTVAGTWSDGTAGTCKSSSVGTCTISKAGVPKTTTVIGFTITNLTLISGFYEPSANHDPDGDSNGTTIQVFGP